MVHDPSAGSNWIAYPGTCLIDSLAIFATINRGLSMKTKTLSARTVREDLGIRPGNADISGGRVGTACFNGAELRKYFPSTISHEKAASGWNFQTPHGPIRLTDYWWNVHDVEWSIHTNNPRAMVWVRRMLRYLGIRNKVSGDNSDRDMVRNFLKQD